MEQELAICSVCGYVYPSFPINGSLGGVSSEFTIEHLVALRKLITHQAHSPEQGQRHSTIRGGAA